MIDDEEPRPNVGDMVLVDFGAERPTMLALLTCIDEDSQRAAVTPDGTRVTMWFDLTRIERA